MTHPLDDEARDLLNYVEANPPPPATDIPIEEFRRLAHDALRVSGEPEPLENVGDEQVPGAASQLGARRYLPSERDPGLFVYFHGGGFVRGDLDTHDPLCRRLANQARLELLSVDYRLAPEHPFPAAAEDAIAVTAVGRPRGGGTAGDRRATAPAGTWRRSPQSTRGTRARPPSPARCCCTR